VSFTGILLNVDAAVLPNHVNGDVPAGVTSGTTPKANIEALDWTWAAATGTFTNL
jgi:hypothetical protein